MKTDKIILGIDPGTTIMGFGVIRILEKEMQLIEFGVIPFKGEESQALRLKKIFEETVTIIERNKPDEFAIESPFFGKNIQSMFKLGRAQGVAIAAALIRTIPIFEYSPKKVKLSVTGNGNASKEQVSGMICKLLKISDPGNYFDATDAVAVAVCHYFQLSTGQLTTGKSEKKFKSWKSFVESNPERIMLPLNPLKGT